MLPVQQHNILILTKKSKHYMFNNKLNRVGGGKGYPIKGVNLYIINNIAINSTFNNLFTNIYLMLS